MKKSLAATALWASLTLLAASSAFAADAEPTARALSKATERVTFDVVVQRVVGAESSVVKAGVPFEPLTVVSGATVETLSRLEFDFSDSVEKQTKSSLSQKGDSITTTACGGIYEGEFWGDLDVLVTVPIDKSTTQTVSNKSSLRASLDRWTVYSSTYSSEGKRGVEYITLVRAHVS